VSPSSAQPRWDFDFLPRARSSAFRYRVIRFPSTRSFAPTSRERSSDNRRRIARARRVIRDFRSTCSRCGMMLRVDTRWRPNNSYRRSDISEPPHGRTRNLLVRAINREWSQTEIPESLSSFRNDTLSRQLITCPAEIHACGRTQAYILDRGRIINGISLTRFLSVAPWEQADEWSSPWHVSR